MAILMLVRSKELSHTVKKICNENHDNDSFYWAFWMDKAGPKIWFKQFS